MSHDPARDPACPSVTTTLWPGLHDGYGKADWGPFRVAVDRCGCLTSAPPLPNSRAANSKRAASRLTLTMKRHQRVRVPRPVLVLLVAGRRSRGSHSRYSRALRAAGSRTRTTGRRPARYHEQSNRASGILPRSPVAKPGKKIRSEFGARAPLAEG